MLGVVPTFNKEKIIINTLLIALLTDHYERSPRTPCIMAGAYISKNINPPPFARLSLPQTKIRSNTVKELSEHEVKAIFRTQEPHLTWVVGGNKHPTIIVAIV